MQALTIPLDAVVRANAHHSITFQDSAAAGIVAISKGNDGQTPQPLNLQEVGILTALRLPRALPRALAAQVAHPEQVLARLVLAGLLEVKRGDRFVSGIAAFERETTAFAPEDLDESRRVSELALSYAVAARHLPVAMLAERLYAFNTLPRSPSAKQDPEEYFRKLTGIDLSTPCPEIGGRAWNVTFHPSWVYFGLGAASGNRFKVYLCPRPEDTHAVIPAFAQILSRSSGAIFKIAYPAGSLVRPDKIVTYLPSFEDLEATLSLLVHSVPAARAQTVPFSAPVPGSSLFSWGVDPPGGSDRVARSWRSWLTHQIAETAHEVPKAARSDEAFEHLRAALLLKDIDPYTWLPRQQMLAQKWRIQL